MPILNSARESFNKQMENRTNFLKRATLRSKSHHQLKISNISTRTLNQLQSQESRVSIKKENIKDFMVIGTFDRKVILSYNNQLKLFGCFDLHAVHQRIRYEYYCWKIKSEEWLNTKVSPFDTAVIEKGGKEPHNAYGSFKKCLIKIYEAEQLLHGCFKCNRFSAWGICFQRNASKEVYVTSYRSIFGRQLTSLQIISIAKQLPTLKRENLPRVINDWIGQFSCKSAFKFNDTLTNDQAKLLILNLSHCEFPWHCVHGRTTIHIKPWKRVKN